MSDFLFEQQVALLLGDIAAGMVIPVVGSDLLQVRYEEKNVPLYDYVAMKLAERLRIPGEISPNLNAVFCEYLKQPRAWHGNGRPVPEDIYSWIPQIFKEAPLLPPQPLLDLAAIRKFNVFVTLTFDSLLVSAINRVRFNGEENTVERKYSQTPEDLPQQSDPSHPVVYHLFGKMSHLAYEYVVSDEDMLEFVHLLQRPLPINLFTALKDNSLLFVGCTFSDWLARFLLRIAYERRLSQGGRRGRDMLVGSTVDPAGNFRLFLDTFSPSTQFIEHPPAEFVSALATRYRERFPDEEHGSPPRDGDFNFDGMEEGTVFISYAHEDGDATQRLHDFLLASNIKVWWDKRENQIGDDWKRMQTRNIESCAYFMPVISAKSAGRMEGEYRGEWSQAIQRAHNRHGSIPLILPVAIDDTSPKANGVPDEFGTSHWVSLPNGVGTAAFAQIMKRRMREYARSKQRA